MSEVLDPKNAIDPPYEDEDVVAVMLTNNSHWVEIKQGSYKPALMKEYDAVGNLQHRVIVVCEDIFTTDQITFEAHLVLAVRYNKEKKSAIPNVTEDNRMLP